MSPEGGEPCLVGRPKLELENVIDRALILSTGSTLHVEEMLTFATHTTARQLAHERLDNVQRAHIRQVLEACDGKIDGKGHAAERLGLNPSTLRSWMERLGITRPARPAWPSEPSR